MIRHCVPAFICAAVLAWTLPLAAADRRAPVSEPAASDLEQRLSNVERILQSQGLLDMLQQLQSLQREIKDLRGQIEVNNHEIEKLKARQGDLHGAIEQGRRTPAAGGAATGESPPLEVITAAEPAADVAGEQAGTTLTVETVSPESQGAVDAAAGGTPAPGAEAAVATADPIKAQAEYQQAFQLLKEAEYDQAISAFNTFLNKYPDSQYSDNAQYWMGEAFYVTRRFDAAITEYMKLVTNYPQSQKAANGLLKIGYSYYELNKPDEAKKVLEDLVQRYPDSPAARDAENRLKRDGAPR